VARALLGDPAILILDEALTGVDLETEAAIMRDIRAAFSDRTLLVITHRLNAVGDFDRIVNIADGVISSEAA
jgi:ABC-type multidrug transport system fused ATPase/permease subunit